MLKRSAERIDRMDMNLPWSKIASPIPEKVTSPQNLIDRLSHTNSNFRNPVTSKSLATLS